MALIQTAITIDGREFTQTRSDAGYMIEQTDTGILYDEAIDPADNPMGHTYAETDELIDGYESDAAYAMAGRILLGEED